MTFTKDTNADYCTAYGTDTDTIKRNKDSYTEGKHFYLLTGENLKRFMGDNLSLTISNMTRTLLPLDRNREHYYCTAGGVVWNNRNYPQQQFQPQ